MTISFLCLFSSAASLCLQSKGLRISHQQLHDPGQPHSPGSGSHKSYLQLTPKTQQKDGLQPYWTSGLKPVHSLQLQCWRAPHLPDTCLFLPTSQSPTPGSHLPCSQGAWHIMILECLSPCYNATVFRADCLFSLCSRFRSWLGKVPNESLPIHWFSLLANKPGSAFSKASLKIFSINLGDAGKSWQAGWSEKKSRKP